MDTSNYKDVLKLATTPEEKEKVTLILDEIYPGEKRDVPDPYHGGDEGFVNVYDMLDRACTKIAKRI